MCTPACGVPCQVRASVCCSAHVLISLQSEQSVVEWESHLKGAFSFFFGSFTLSRVLVVLFISRNQLFFSCVRRNPRVVFRACVHRRGASRVGFAHRCVIALVCPSRCKANNGSLSGCVELAISQAFAFFRCVFQSFYAFLKRNQFCSSSGISSHSFARSSFFFGRASRVWSA